MLCTSMLYIFARATADKVAIRGVRRAYFQLAPGDHAFHTLNNYLEGRDTASDAALKIGAASMLRRTYYCEISKRLPG